MIIFLLKSQILRKMFYIINILGLIYILILYTQTHRHTHTHTHTYIYIYIHEINKGSESPKKECSMHSYLIQNILAEQNIHFCLKNKKFRNSDDQLEHTFSSYVRIRDIALKTCQKRWMIGRSGERMSRISMLAVRNDDGDSISIIHCEFHTMSFNNRNKFIIDTGILFLNFLFFKQLYIYIYIYIYNLKANSL